MKTRDFDPVLAAALRNELESLADGRAAAPTRPRRRQWLVTVATAVVLLAATVGVLRLTNPHAFTPAAPHPGVVDQLRAITDPADPHYIRQKPVVLLRVNGTGPGSWRFAVPQGVTSVTTYVSCSPAGTYEAGIDDPDGLRSACDRTGPAGFGDTPVTTGAHTAHLRVPAGTAFSLLLIETPQYTPSTAGPALPAVAYPAAETEVLARERGDHRIATGRLPALLHGVGIAIRCRGTGSVIVSTPFGSNGSPADYSRCGRTAARTTSLSLGGETVQTAASTYTIRAYGDVAWAVVLSRLPDDTAGPLPYPDPSGIAGAGAVLDRRSGAEGGAATTGAVGPSSGRVLAVLTCRAVDGSTGSTVRLRIVGGPRLTSQPCSTNDPTRTVRPATVPEDGFRYTMDPDSGVQWTLTLVEDR